MAIDISQFMAVFYEESFEGLDLIESSLLAMDLQAPDMEAVHAVFRAMHSLKGGSGTFGLREIIDLTHVEETLLDQVREGKRPMTAALVDHLLRAVDALRAMISAKMQNQPLDLSQAEQLHEQCLHLLADDEAQSSAQQADTVAGVTSDPTSDPASNVWLIDFVPQAHILQNGNDVVRILRELHELALEWHAEAYVPQLPEWQVFQPEQLYMRWQIRLRGESLSRERLQEPFDWILDECQLDIRMQEPVERETASNADSTTGLDAIPQSEHARSQVVGYDQPNRDAASSIVAPTQQSAGVAEPARKMAVVAERDAGSIRVGLDKVDALVNLVGELVITQSMLQQVGENFSMQQLGRLQDGLAQLAQHTRQLQENVMRIRMLPISFVFSRFPRLVRDTAAQLGKQVHLDLRGENTELDKTVLEKIADPLTHLVRNALDHGLEPVEERRAAGKDTTGILTMDAYHQGGHMVIEVRDDGRGIDPKRIRAKAIEKGILAADAVLSDDALVDLIFAPGFSTAEQVSDLSGRGVGMDVVRRNVEALKGSVVVRTNLGQGSTFIMRLPLTLAILDGQLVQVAHEVFVLPMVSMIESIPVMPGQIRAMAGSRPVFPWREHYLSVLRLEEIFHLKRPRSLAQTPRESILVIVEAGSEMLALQVDALLSQQQVVIKALDTHYRHVPGISGATILGNGRVSLIIDVSAVLSIAGQSSHNQKAL